jgi:hypothetical protein
LAGGLGFEPRQAESESAVLPLDDPPMPGSGGPGKCAAPHRERGRITARSGLRKNGSPRPKREPMRARLDRLPVSVRPRRFFPAPAGSRPKGLEFLASRWRGRALGYVGWLGGRDLRLSPAYFLPCIHPSVCFSFTGGALMLSSRQMQPEIGLMRGQAAPQCRCPDPGTGDVTCQT